MADNSQILSTKLASRSIMCTFFRMFFKSAISYFLAHHCSVHAFYSMWSELVTHLLFQCASFFGKILLQMKNIQNPPLDTGVSFLGHWDWLHWRHVWVILWTTIEKERGSDAECLSMDSILMAIDGTNIYDWDVWVIETQKLFIKINLYSHEIICILTHVNAIKMWHVPFWCSK